LVEDHARMRESFALALNESSTVRCVATYATGEEALRAIPAAPPDVVLMDIHLPRMSGIACVARLKAVLPGLQILMLTRFEENGIIFEALQAGASGYLVKQVRPAELVEAIEQVHAGGAPMSMHIARKVIEHFRGLPKPSGGVENLTPREQDVLRLLARGSLYKNIADTLGISMNTLRTHLRAIYEKLHVHSRTEAAMKLVDPHRFDSGGPAGPMNGDPRGHSPPI
jgi:DNA-binding NarL/FixJ family response regulator